MKTHLRYIHLIGKGLHDIVDDHPINRLPASKNLQEKQKLPQLLVDRINYSVN